MYDDDDLYEDRTHEAFAQFAYNDEDDNHQLRESPLLKLNMDLIKDVVLDSMHVVFQGVVKRYLQFLVCVKGSTCRLPRGLLTEVCVRMVSLNGALPSDFVRQPRSLQYLPYWKATEFRSFLLYSGPVVLKGILSTDRYNHFMHLSVAIYILSEEDDASRNRFLDYADHCLMVFVKKSKHDRYLGELFRVYNVHNLIHIAEDVRHFNEPLQRISAFLFETYLQRLKKYVRANVSHWRKFTRLTMNN